MSKSAVFGYELLLDLYDCKAGVCDDLTLCYNFLDEVVGFLGMEKQAPPSIFRSDATRFPDKAGLSGWEASESPSTAEASRQAEASTETAEASETKGPEIRCESAALYRRRRMMPSTTETVPPKGFFECLFGGPAG